MIYETYAEVPFIWLIWENGTYLYRTDDIGYVKKIVEMLQIFRESKREYYVFFWNTKDLRHTFPHRVLKWAENEIKEAKNDKCNWHGRLENVFESLLDCGLLVRWVSAQNNWQCIYEYPDEKHVYCIGSISEEELEAIFISGWGKDSIEDFMINCCSDWNEWKGLPMCHKIDDFLAYFTAERLFGKPDNYYTTTDILKKLNVKISFC